MGEDDRIRLLAREDIPLWRKRLAELVDGPRAQALITAIVLINALELGLRTDADVLRAIGPLLHAIDLVCLSVFVLEIAAKLLTYRAGFWRSGWNVFDFAIVSIALVPGSGPWAVLRALRVLRVLRLLTVVPSLRRVVAAFLHAIPGLAGVVAVMAIFYYTAGVLATNLFGETHAQWFGTLGKSLYTLFQVMTLESWSMGIARPVMVSHPWAWAFFIPFIILATFTILNLFIGVIVSTMQELGAAQFDPSPSADLAAGLERLEAEVRALRRAVGARSPPVDRHKA
ncbi:MAG: ion transporter [Deltaproteobacteria bacterium]|nr:ion transporter [Deltaproteobacteria bacterium]